MLLLQKLLSFFSRLILKKYQPKIIGITGSVGKTSAKEVIYAVIKEKFNVRRAIKNYNNELGVPLTIIGEESGGKNLWRWLMIFFRAWKLIIKKDPHYPEILILEMGADKPGDIKYLTAFAPCDIGVLTAVGPTHLENFKTIKKVVEEKQIILKHLTSDGTAIFNNDDEIIVDAKIKTKAQVISFGFNSGSEIVASDLKIIQEMEDGLFVTKGETFKMNYRGSFMPVQLNGVVGKQAVYAALSGVAVGVTLGINLLEIIGALKKMVWPPSRMRIVPGIKYTTLIDDSYNSSPKAVEMALSAFREIQVEPGSRKIVVLGDMLELGSYTTEGHAKVAEYLKKMNIDFLITVGERAKIIAEKIKELGFSDDKIVKFSKSSEAGLFLQEKIQIGDLVLIKGSQGARMEKIVVELMAEPTQAEEVVCRQDKTWQNK